MAVTHRFVVMIDSNGTTTVCPAEKHVAEGDRVWWMPATSTEAVRIEFDDETPVKWRSKKESAGETVKGTVQRGTMGNSYKYKPQRSRRQGRKRAQPELIVDGRRRKATKARRDR